MLNAHSSSVKYHGPNAVFLRFVLILIFIILILVSFLLFGYLNSYGDPLNRVESITQSQRIIGNQVKPFMEEHFKEAPWYPLIETIENEGDKITIKTLIFPDPKGREQAEDIIGIMRRQGIEGEISVYGRNMSYSLLARGKYVLMKDK